VSPLRSIPPGVDKAPVALIVQLTLIRHHVNRPDVSYFRGQVYLDRHAKELMLRNRV
jgi:uncharacterized protein YbgA (DUF1722 family)